MAMDPSSGMVIRQLGNVTWSDHLRTLVRRYGYGGILIGSLLVLWWVWRAHTRSSTYPTPSTS